VKNGAQIERFMEGGIKFDDGSELEADVVIFATGYCYCFPPLRLVHALMCKMLVMVTSVTISVEYVATLWLTNVSRSGDSTRRERLVV
jgi:hypothetical protein